MSSIRILLVEDDTTDQELVKQELASKRHEVVFADTGESALKALSSGSFDIVILDYHLPGIQGSELIHEIGKHFPALPVIVITESKNPFLVRDAFRSGAADYISKDQLHDKLATVIHEFESKSKINQENIANLQVINEKLAGMKPFNI